MPNPDSAGPGSLSELQEGRQWSGGVVGRNGVACKWVSVCKVVIRDTFSCVGLISRSVVGQFENLRIGVRATGGIVAALSVKSGVAMIYTLKSPF